jgi:malonyl-CoA O-methyltransferase
MSIRSNESVAASTVSADVAAAYDAWSAHYDQDDNPMIAMADAALAELLPRVAGWSVLELGCGTGRNAAALLAADAARYVGVDVSAGMLAQARARVNDPRAAWIEADLVDDRVADDTTRAVDLVLISLVLEHIAALPPVIARAVRALAPGGLLRIHEIHPDLRATGTQAHYRDGDRDVPVASYPHTSDDFRAAVAAAGLSLVSVTDRIATDDDLARSRKLGKHLGRPVLIEITARRD